MIAAPHLNRVLGAVMINRIPTSIALATLAMAIGSRSVHAQLPESVIPLHSFEDLPSPPLSTADLFKRFGDVTVPAGQTEKGDLETEALRTRIAGWLKPAGPPSAAEISAMMQGGGRMSPAAGDAIGKLLQVSGKMRADFTQAVQTFGLTTMPPMRKSLETKLDQIHKSYDPKIERCLTEHERAGGSGCSDPTPERDAAINAATTTFLKDASAAFGDYKGRLKMIASDGEGIIESASKSLGGAKPAIAQTQIRMIRQNELNALLAGLTAETDIVVYAYSHAAPPRQQAHKP